MDSKLLELLVCPVTKGPLIFSKNKDELISRSARLAYPIRSGIPVLIESEARTLKDEEIDRYRVVLVRPYLLARSKAISFVDLPGELAQG